MSQGGKSECRALVPLGEGLTGNAQARAAAPFVVQLTASNKGFAAYRTKRRTDPAAGTNSYRAAATRSRALPGGKLNYCA